MSVCHTTGMFFVCLFNDFVYTTCISVVMVTIQGVHTGIFIQTQLQNKGRFKSCTNCVDVPHPHHYCKFN